MGKEPITKPKHILEQGSTKSEAPRQFVDPARLFTELETTWNSAVGIGLQSHIKEDGKVVVILRRNGLDTVTLCSGFTNEENKCISLLQVLLRQGLIFKDDYIKNFLLKKECLWVNLNIQKGFFKSGDSIMIVLTKAQAVMPSSATTSIDSQLEKKQVLLPKEPMGKRKRPMKNINKKKGKMNNNIIPTRLACPEAC